MGWLLLVDRAHDRERQDYEAYKEVWEPYLANNADLLQVACSRQLRASWVIRGESPSLPTRIPQGSLL